MTPATYPSDVSDTVAVPVRIRIDGASGTVGSATYRLCRSTFSKSSAHDSTEVSVTDSGNSGYSSDSIPPAVGSVGFGMSPAVHGSGVRVGVSVDVSSDSDGVNSVVDDGDSTCSVSLREQPDRVARLPSPTRIARLRYEDM